MCDRKDGGPAFPLALEDTAERPLLEGMGLRDWFAGQALAAIVHADVEIGPESGVPPEQMAEAFAKTAYRIADAMLKARGES